MFIGSDAVHLVPRPRADWFRQNDMARRNGAGVRTGVHDPANGLTLRRDVGVCSSCLAKKTVDVSIMLQTRQHSTPLT